jgi:hypothetical protein
VKLAVKQFGGVDKMRKFGNAIWRFMQTIGEDRYKRYRKNPGAYWY